MSAGVTFEAVVRARWDAADGVVVLDLERASGVLPHWSPGAHIDVVLPGGIERQYSLLARLLEASPPMRGGGMGTSRWAPRVAGSGLATRYDKLALTYRGNVVLRAMTLWLKATT